MHAEAFSDFRLHESHRPVRIRIHDICEIYDRALYREPFESARCFTGICPLAPEFFANPHARGYIRFSCGTHSYTLIKTSHLSSLWLLSRYETSILFISICQSTAFYYVFSLLYVSVLSLFSYLTVTMFASLTAFFLLRTLEDAFLRRIVS